jgi:dihydropteroate synthase
VSVISDAPTWAGIVLDRPRLMGILNVTPDSFSDGGRWTDPAQAIDAGLAMAAAGADIIDVGGESTRPGAVALPASEEIDRIIPVVAALAAHGIIVSVDTRHAETMRAVLAVGARIINDISGLTFDPDAADVVAAHKCPVILMHMRGTPETMARAAQYLDTVGEIRDELRHRVDAARAAGIAPSMIALDPGIGFAKEANHNLAVLQSLDRITALGYPVIIGVSRKRFIGSIANEPVPHCRLAGSLAAGLFSIMRGASILRVHDVRETFQAIRVWHALNH